MDFHFMLILGPHRVSVCGKVVNLENLFHFSVGFSLGLIWRKQPRQYLGGSGAGNSRFELYSTSITTVLYLYRMQALTWALY
jgi:hypothetical protein